MIACLRGELFYKTPEKVVIDVGGVGYEVFISLSTHERLPEVGEEVFVHVHTNVREDAITLFGFLDADEKGMFLLLIHVSGVGPKLAMSILSGIRPPELAMAIGRRDIKRLTALAGVGKKTAERLCLDLKDKVALFARAGVSAPEEVPVTHVEDQMATDVMSALINLGYPRVRAYEALAQVKKRIPADKFAAMRVEELIRAALRTLA